MNRRRFLQGALAAPVVISTPGLLMPVKPRLAEESAGIRVLYMNSVTGEERWVYARMVEFEVHNPDNISGRTHIDLGGSRTYVLEG